MIHLEINEELTEVVADFEHNQWRHWMNYLFGSRIRGIERKSGHVTVRFTEEDFDRWDRQREATYEELSEKEKESDRLWAKKILSLMERETMRQAGNSLKQQGNSSGKRR